MISNRLGRLGRLCLLRSACRIGESVRGFFDFGLATLPCLRCSMALVLEERLLLIPRSSCNFLTDSEKSLVLLPHLMENGYLPIFLSSQLQPKGKRKLTR
ncbi:unnamed protein product [Protopolystoma xenopodis]|uniref:Uncharacterized protein n=1 Tax=Protopolystoma xenopodis TaxID=117903 RepID=A0A3S5BE16_9PLAT|nr:unnamed protein product [Protopolystoma xenopodis]